MKRDLILASVLPQKGREVQRIFSIDSKCSRTCDSPLSLDHPELDAESQIEAI